MATNKHAVIRYKTLDKCFRNSGRKYTFQELLDAVNNALSDFDSASGGIETRQLRSDINFMRSEAGYNAPIITEKEGKVHFYKYRDKKFSINNSPINATEAEQLKSLIGVLQRFEGAPELEWINEIGPMLTNQFGLNNSDNKVISYDNNIDYSGYDKITPLFNAIVNKRVLEIEYEPFNKPKFTLIFHPYYLKQFNNRWFVFGYNEFLCNPLWNLALDRILYLNEISAKYLETDINWDEYFYDIIGVTVPDKGEIEEIELLFTTDQASYIITKPLHPSQKSIRLETGELLVRLKLIPNYELEMRLLSYANKVKIVKPLYLSTNIKERLAKALEQY